MPFEIRKDGPDDTPFCVYTQEKNGKRHGCHQTREEAIQQLRALYANVPEARPDAQMSLFAKWDTEKREAYLKSHPENWGDPENARFPIEDQDDIDSAVHLIGRAKASDDQKERIKTRLIEIAQRLKLDISDAWQGNARMGAGSSEFAGRRHNSEDQADIQQIHDISTNQGAECRTNYSSGKPGRRKGMKLLDGLRALLGDAADKEVPEQALFSDTEPAPSPPDTSTASGSARVKAMEVELANQRRAMAEMSERQRAQDAATFADGLKRQGKITPAQEARVVAVYNWAAQQGGTVTFADGEKMDGLAAFRSLMESAPEMHLTEEMLASLASNGGSVLLHQSSQFKTEEEEVVFHRERAKRYAEEEEKRMEKIRASNGRGS